MFIQRVVTLKVQCTILQLSFFFQKRKLHILYKQSILIQPSFRTVLQGKDSDIGQYSEIALQQYSVIAIQGYSDIALQRYSIIAVQHYSDIALQQYYSEDEILLFWITTIYAILEPHGTSLQRMACKNAQSDLPFHQYYILASKKEKNKVSNRKVFNHFYSSQFQILCSTKCSSETLQNLPYFIYTKKQLWVFVYITYGKF